MFLIDMFLIANVYCFGDLAIESISIADNSNQELRALLLATSIQRNNVLSYLIRTVCFAILCLASKRVELCLKGLLFSILYVVRAIN